MVEELKAEMRKLKNMIGFEGKVDVTSRPFTLELIRSLDAKYKDDVQSRLRLHQLEFNRDLVESSRHIQRKNVEVKEKLTAEKKKEKKDGDDDDEEEVKAPVKEKELFKKPEEAVSIRAENIDEWKDLKTMSRIYYVLEHPNSTGITWKRRISKKKTISKFSDKDLIEWNVSEKFKLRSLEEWALSQNEARKLADKSPYDNYDSIEDDESRELEDMFNILDTQKQKKRKVGKLEKCLKSNRPFKFKDESVEDWTESYSDDSEESGAEDMGEELLEIEEAFDYKIDDYKMSTEEPTIDEEKTVSKIFSVYEEKEKFKNPIFEELDETEPMELWFDMCHKTIGAPQAEVAERPPTPRFMFTVDENEGEKYTETEIPDDTGYVRGHAIELSEAKEKDIEKPGGRIFVKEVNERDLEKPGEYSEDYIPNQGETMLVKEDFKKKPSLESADKSSEDIDALDEIELSDQDEDTVGKNFSTNYHKPLKFSEKESGMDHGKSIEVRGVTEVKEEDIEKPGGKIPVKEVNEEDLEKPGEDSEDPTLYGSYQGETTHIKEAWEKDIEKPGERIPVEEAKEQDIEKQSSLESTEKSFDDLEVLDETEFSDTDEEPDSKYPTNSFEPFKPSEKQSREEHGKSSITTSEEGAVSKDDEEVLDDKIKKLVKESKGYALSDVENQSVYEPPSSKPTSSEKGPVSKKDEEILGDEIKKMVKEGKSNVLSDVENEAVYKPPGSKPSTSSEKGPVSKKDEEILGDEIKKMVKEGKSNVLSDVKNEALYEPAARKSSTLSETAVSKSVPSFEKQLMKEKLVASHESQATKKKSVPSFENQLMKKKSVSSHENQATKKKSITSSEKQPTRKKSYGSSENTATRKKSSLSTEKPVSEKKSDITTKKPVIKNKYIATPKIQLTKKKSVTSSEMHLTNKKSESSAGKKLIEREPLISPDEQPTKKKSDSTSGAQWSNKKNATSSEMQKSFKVPGTSSEMQETSKEPSTSSSSLEISVKSELGKNRIKGLLGNVLGEAEVNASEEKDIGYQERRATLSHDASISIGQELEGILKSESSLNLKKSDNDKDEESPKSDKSEAEEDTEDLERRGNVDRDRKGP